MENVKIEKLKSESLSVGILLALVGGFLDTYSYILRGHVFANAETGNMVLFGINLSEGNWSEAVVYMIPIISFFSGIMIAEIIKRRYDRKISCWRIISIVIEIIAIIAVAFMPTSLDRIANALISFVCALQVESFRKINGNPYATTMCTGNLRSGTENLHHYFATKDKKWLHKSLHYFLIICIFIVGAYIGSVLSNNYGNLCIIFTVIPLLIVGITIREEKIE